HCGPCPLRRPGLDRRAADLSSLGSAAVRRWTATAGATGIGGKARVAAHQTQPVGGVMVGMIEDREGVGGHIFPLGTRGGGRIPESHPPPIPRRTTRDGPRGGWTALPRRRQVGCRDDTVATFHDANPSAPATDFTATITWGDGSPD